MKTIEVIQSRIDHAQPMDFGSVFGASIELFKKSWIHGFVYNLMQVLLMLPFLLIIYIPILLMVFAENDGFNSDVSSVRAFFASFSVLYLIVIIVGAFVVNAVVLCLNAAFYCILDNLDRGLEARTADLFQFLKAPYLTKAFLLVLATMLISLIATLLCVLPVLYVLVPIYYFTVVFAFNPDMSVSDIINIGFRLGNKKWLLSFGLIIVSSLLASAVGSLLCFVGVLVTAAFVYHPVYLIYRDVIGTD